MLLLSQLSLFGLGQFVTLLHSCADLLHFFQAELKVMYRNKVLTAKTGLGCDKDRKAFNEVDLLWLSDVNDSLDKLECEVTFTKKTMLSRCFSSILKKIIH